MTGLSVLMTVYRADDPAHLATALDSVLAQTLQSDDVVLAVDGPIEGELRATVERYQAAHPQVRPLWFPVNRGLGLALHDAVPQCRHELVARMDADDVAHPERFAKQVAYLEAHPDVALLSSPILEFDGDLSNVLSERRVPADDAAIRRMARRWNPMNHPAVVFRKSAVLAVGGYEDFARHEDYHLWVRMLMAGYRAANLTEPLLWYRSDATNLARRRSTASTRAAIRFHLWKHRAGFAGIVDTIAPLVALVGAWAVPESVFERLYRARRAPSAGPASRTTRPEALSD